MKSRARRDGLRRCIDDCIKVGFFNADDAILAANQVEMPYAYVVDDHARPANVAAILNRLSQHDIHLAGRYSEWKYYNSNHAFLAGKKVAEEVQAALTDRSLPASEFPNRTGISRDTVSAHTAAPLRKIQTVSGG